ncbi:MAG: hypothetical protein HKN42_10870 [Granulosicoccus sp.]|nr:hypothetical protein [Granulosicoccus sp.]
MGISTLGIQAGSVAFSTSADGVPLNLLVQAIVQELSWPIMKSRLRLSVPDDTILTGRLYEVKKADSAGRFCVALMRLIPPVIRWQLERGIIRKPRQIRAFARLLKEMHPLTLLVSMGTASTGERAAILRTALTGASMVMVRELIDHPDSANVRGEGDA